MSAIELAGVTKSYRKRRGVTDINLIVERGEVFGYLGPNGAGKTTTIRMLVDVLRPDTGTVTVFGRSPADPKLRAEIGYLAGDLHLYDSLTGREMLTHLDHLRGRGHMKRALELATRLDVDLGRRIRTLSKGNKQKIGVVQALMHRPKLLILDEPSSGLDPLMQQELFAMLEEARVEGATVFLSSHILSEVDRMAARVGIIREGRLVDVAPIGTLKERALRHFEIEFQSEVPMDVFHTLPGVSNIVANGHTVSGRFAGSADGLIKAAAVSPVKNFVCEDADLESLFLSYYRSGNAQ